MMGFRLFVFPEVGDAMNQFSHCLLKTLLVAAFTLPLSVRADIYRWDNGEPVSSTQGIEPQPGIQLDSHQLQFANFLDRDLTGGSFENSNLHAARLTGATLRHVNFGGANLSHARLNHAHLQHADLTNANLSDANLNGASLVFVKMPGAIIAGANLSSVTSFTEHQLYSTSSYQQQNLSGIVLDGDLAGWDFSGQNLTGASLDAMLHGTDFTNAVIAHATFNGTTSRGFTKERLYSSASYRRGNLRYISLSDNDLSGWSFAGQDLTGAKFLSTQLVGTDLSGANLTNSQLGGQLESASFARSNLANATVRGDLSHAELTDTIITHADFGSSRGLTIEQFSLTQNYRNKDLRKLGLERVNMVGWDLREQDLSGATLNSADLKNADLRSANLTDASLWSANMVNADLYRANLSNAELGRANIQGANFSDSIVTGVGFPLGVTYAQLRSTASFQELDLRRIAFTDNSLAGWDLSEQNLANATFYRTSLRDTKFSDADLSGSYFGESDLTGAALDRAIVTRTDFRDTTQRGFTQQQLYRTASYQTNDLSGLRLAENDLTGWDLSEQNLEAAQFDLSTLLGTRLNSAKLTGASFRSATLANADFIAADLRNSDLAESTDLALAKFDSRTIYNQWTAFPTDFDPSIAGLTLHISPVGDFDANDVVDASDVDSLTRRVRGGYNSFYQPDFMFDLNDDSRVDHEDLRVWVKDVRRTWFGDANIDGVFESKDLVAVYEAGSYQQDVWADWSQGDWNADGRFDSGDLITAFQDGGYVAALTPAVPEPEFSLVQLAIMTTFMFAVRHQLRNQHSKSGRAALSNGAG